MIKDADPARFRSTKNFIGYPCAHRRHRHQGHCAHIHGYSRSFLLTFSCTQLTENGFVMDFGHLKDVKRWLEENFDHTMLIDADDPLISIFMDLQRQGACKLVVFEDVGMEGTAKFVYERISKWLAHETDGRVRLESVEVRENQKNSAIYGNF